MMKRLALIIGLTLVVFACKKEDKYTDIEIYGHAGDGLNASSAPYQENTIDGIQYACSYGELVGVEVDVQWSRDGTAWLFHDDDLSIETSSSGCVRSKTDEELELVEYKGAFGVSLPRLNDIASIVKNKKIILDLKKPMDCGDDLTVLEFQNSLNAFSALLEGTEVSVLVQNLDDLAFFQTLGWKVYIATLSTTDYFDTQNWQSTAGCCVRNSTCNKYDVDAVKAQGKEVIIFDARAPKTIRKALKKHPTAFLADDIKATLIEKIR